MHPHQFFDSLCNALFNGESGNSTANSVSRFRPASLSETGRGMHLAGVWTTCTRT